RRLQRERIPRTTWCVTPAGAVCTAAFLDLSLRSMSRSASSQSWVLFVIFLLAMPLAATALRPRFDEDTWWHLAVGRYIETHDFTFPQTDPFSRPGVEQHLPWVAYSWLYELTLYEAYQGFGVAGVLCVRYLLVFLMYLALARFATRSLRHPAGNLAA